MQALGSHLLTACARSFDDDTFGGPWRELVKCATLPVLLCVLGSYRLRGERTERIAWELLALCGCPRRPSRGAACVAGAAWQEHAPIVTARKAFEAACATVPQHPEVRERRWRDWAIAILAPFLRAQVFAASPGGRSPADRDARVGVVPLHDWAGIVHEVLVNDLRCLAGISGVHLSAIGRPGEWSRALPQGGFILPSSVTSVRIEHVQVSGVRMRFNGETRYVCESASEFLTALPTHLQELEWRDVYARKLANFDYIPREDIMDRLETMGGLRVLLLAPRELALAGWVFDDVLKVLAGMRELRVLAAGAGSDYSSGDVAAVSAAAKDVVKRISEACPRLSSLEWVHRGLPELSLDDDEAEEKVCIAAMAAVVAAFPGTKALVNCHMQDLNGVYHATSLDVQVGDFV